MTDRDELAKQLIAEADSGDHPQSTSRLMRIAASALSSQQPVASAAVRECGEQIAWVADEHGSKVLFWKHDGDIPWVAEHYPNAVPLYTARLTQAGK